ncbi:MAG: sugar transferase [Nitriliruptorales bacterium]
MNAPQRGPEGLPSSLADGLAAGSLMDSNFRSVGTELAAAVEGGPELVVQPFLGADFIPHLDGQFSDVAARLHSRWKLGVKRAIDIVGSLLLLILFAPVLLIASLAIISTSPGHVLFVQERLGRDGRPFRMFKFRSMYRDAEARRAELADLNECTGPIFKVRNDPRITPVGRVLRKLSLDEMPQLLNVLRGDMSLVGPRPPLPDEYAVYGPRERGRLAVKPGLTCTWQVSGRSDLDFDTWMEMDLSYIRDWSLWLDVKLLLLTIPAVLSGRGAY